MKIHKIYASSVAKLDSNVYTGGGSDDTQVLQRVLDMAKDGDGVWLVMDGAALVSQLKLHSNTTIECLSKDCGFFQKPQSNGGVVTNAEWDNYEIKTRNITLIGGTYNQDCKNQEQFVPWHEYMFVHHTEKKKYTFGIEFYGVENLRIDGISIRNFRKYACAIGCFRNIIIENTWLDLPDHEDHSNQDGFHFWGPGQFLTLKNCGGTVGDDFVNIGPDEKDRISSITDVLIDGVFLDNADQAMRLLSRDKGRLDRVAIRNVSGTYKGLGFYIGPWFREEGRYGNFGNIFIENVDLKPQKPNYDYRPPFLFSIGGNIESITLKNIRAHAAYDNRTLIELGSPFISYERDFHKEHTAEQKLETVVIEDLLVTEKEDEPWDTKYIQLFGPVKNLILKDINIFKNQPENGCMLALEEGGEVENFIASDIHTTGLKTLIENEEKIKNRI